MNLVICRTLCDNPNPSDNTKFFAYFFCTDCVIIWSQCVKLCLKRSKIEKNRSKNLISNYTTYFVKKINTPIFLTISNFTKFHLIQKIEQRGNSILWTWSLRKLSIKNNALVKLSPSKILVKNSKKSQEKRLKISFRLLAKNHWLKTF